MVNKPFLFLPGTTTHNEFDAGGPKMGMANPAQRVVLSYPADLSTWGRDIVEDRPFRAYLPKAHDEASPGDAWEEFVGVGCCGNSLEVPLRVEDVEGGSELTADTEFEFTVREACDIDGGWAVQSAASPE
jgi:hypothetical protein